MYLIKEPLPNNFIDLEKRIRNKIEELTHEAFEITATGESGDIVNIIDDDSYRNFLQAQADLGWNRVWMNAIVIDSPTTKETKPEDSKEPVKEPKEEQKEEKVLDDPPPEPEIKVNPIGKDHQKPVLKQAKKFKFDDYWW